MEDTLEEDLLEQQDGDSNSTTFAIRSVERFSPESLLHAIHVLFNKGAFGELTSRRAADRFLCDFQRSNAFVPVALQLLHEHCAVSTASSTTSASGHFSSGLLPGEAIMLLAVGLRRRLQRETMQSISANDILQLAGLLLVASSPATLPITSSPFHPPALLLVRAAVAQWLLAGGAPVEALLTDALAGSIQGGVALLAVEAVPEEANAREVRLGKERPLILLQISSAAPRVLHALAGLPALPSASRLTAATQWLLVCDASLETLNGLASSSLLSMAADLLSLGGANGCSGLDFLHALIEKAGGAVGYPELLIESVMQIFAHIRATELESQERLCTLIAFAVKTWRHFFVSQRFGTSPPAPTWVSLLEALNACASWGFRMASSTLPAWYALHSHVTKEGVSEAYVVVFLHAISALRAASRFPEGYEAFTKETQDSFLEYRRELRDTLRALTADAGTRRPLLQQLHSDLTAQIRSGCSWQLAEESLHALSAMAKASMDTSMKSGAAEADVVLDILAGLAGDGGPLSQGGCHRQLIGTTIMCASVYAPIIFEPGKGSSDAKASSCALLTARLLQLAVASLTIEEAPSSGPDAAYPFRAKQDHYGPVCLLKLCSSNSGSAVAAAMGSRDALRREVQKHLSLATYAGQQTLESHSTHVLVEAVALVAARDADLAQVFLSDCLSLACGDGSGTSVALVASAIVISKCGLSQSDALLGPLATAWPHLADPRLDHHGLAVLLKSVADFGPVGALKPLAELIARVFEHQVEARAGLFDVTGAFVHRAAKERHNSTDALLWAAELMHRLSLLTWDQVDAAQAATSRIQLVVECVVQLPGEGSLGVSASHHEIIEAWARVMLEGGKAEYKVLSCNSCMGLILCLKGVVSLVGIPQLEPPVRSLSLLAHCWTERADMKELMGAALATLVIESAGGPWCLGALVVRSVMKAVLGQMPPNALGVLVPAARALFQHGNSAVENWFSRALKDEHFPNQNIKSEAKTRFIKECLESHADGQRFKQALKKFCGGKKKGM